MEHDVSAIKGSFSRSPIQFDDVLAIKKANSIWYQIELVFLRKAT